MSFLEVPTDPIQRVLMTYKEGDRFELKQVHLTLLKEANVGWLHYAYEGSPGFDSKRPFGNSDVTTDLAEIICGDGHRNIDEEQFRYDKEGDIKWVRDLQGVKWKPEDLWRVYRELDTVLQIILLNQTFELGWYVRDAVWSYRSWRKEVEA